MHFTAILAAAALAALSATSAQAAVRITDDPGGLMTQYASRFSAVRQTGEKVVIDGPCLSACTMVLGILPREQVCVTHNAVLGFHAAWNYNGHGRRVTSAVATQALIDIYGLTNESSVLDVGCGKAFLLYEMKKLLPGLKVSGEAPDQG